MSTGACGIDCGVCRLNRIGVCSSCGSGKSQEGFKKLAAQHRILGAPCPVLECAVEHRVAYCPGDCDEFPCIVFEAGPYPFSRGFLHMQKRRRGERPNGRRPSGEIVKVPMEYWEALKQRDSAVLCKNSLARPSPPDGFLLRFLGKDLLVDIERFCLCYRRGARWEHFQEPLVELICLVYLLNAGPEPLSDEMISVEGLRDGRFFQGPHELMIQPLLDRYANDLNGFKEAVKVLKGESLELADAAYGIWALPKIPIYYLLWQGDEEFEPRLSILFDRSIEYHLSADAIWGLVNHVSHILLIANRASKEGAPRFLS